MWRDLAPVGRSAASGGYFRQPFTTAERECQAWFAQEAEARSLDLEYDGFGNAVAWWNPPGGVVRDEMARPHGVDSGGGRNTGCFGCFPE